METVLLTGATGFLGSHLLKGLLEETYRVVILKRTFSDTWRIEHVLDKIRTYSIDKVPLEEVFKENKIDAVINAATTYGKKGNGLASIIESNLLLPVKLLELSISYNIPTFINTDSFFNTADLNYKHLAPYSLSKKQLVEWLKTVSDKIHIVNMKLEHLYGPGDTNNKFVTWLAKECIENKPELNLTKGEQKRDFIYVSDAANAFLAALKEKGSLPDYAEFGVGTGEGTSIREFAIKVKETVSAVSGKEVGTSLNFGALPYTEGEIMESKADNAALKQLGWNCSVGLNEGLKNTITELIDRMDK